MQITHDLNSKKLWLSQQKYIERLLERYNMKENKQVSSPLGDHFKLSRKCCSTLDEEKKKDEKYSLLLSCGEFNVCYGMHKAKYSSCSWSCE